MTEITRDQIVELLHEMNDRLAKRGVAGEIVLCGGAVMTLCLDARSATKDVDALFAPSSVLREIAEQIADDHRINYDWFNDAAKGFIDMSRMGVEEVADLGNLHIMRLGNKEMLALKLASARFDSKDFGDALFLMELVGVRYLNHVYEIVEQYIPAQRLTPKVSYFIQQVFEAYEKGQLSREEHAREANRIEDQRLPGQNQNPSRGQSL